jgi:hypothetical protein
MDINDGIATVSLKGDANAVPDAVPYTLRQADRVIFSAPLLGYVVAWLSSSAAVFAGGLFTAYLLYLAFGHRGNSRPPRDEDDDGKPGRASGGKNLPVGKHPKRPSGQDKRRMGLLTGTTAASVLALAGSALHTATPSHAAFADSSTAVGSYTAASLGTPKMTCANSGDYDVTLTLTHPGDFATQYELRSLLPAKTWATAPWPSGNSVRVTIDADDEAFSFSQQTTVTFQASSKFGSWTSTPASYNVEFQPEVRVLIVLSRASLRCN